MVAAFAVRGSALETWLGWWWWVGSGMGIGEVEVSDVFTVDDEC